MRITIRIDEALLDQARRETRRRGETLAALIEQGLQLVLAQRWVPVVLPVSRASGGLRPGVDLNDSAALLDTLEGRPRPVRSSPSDRP